MMNTIKRFWALCLGTHMKLALYKYAIIIIVMRPSLHEEAFHSAGPMCGEDTTKQWFLLTRDQ